MKNNYKIILLISLVIMIISMISFRKILDNTQKKRNRKIEYIVVHYTANLGETADAEANAKYLQKKRQAGTHYCIDDTEILQCTDECNVAYAVGDNKWFGFIQKPWLKSKINNNNSLSYEMCLGGGRNDSLILEVTAQQVGWQLINKGFYNSKDEVDVGRVVRHHDVTGKHCPKFSYINSKTGKADDNYWDQALEDRLFWKFKQRVKFYAEMHLKRKRNVNGVVKSK